MERKPRHDVLLIFGAQTPNLARQPRKREMGRKGIARMNKNGERLVEFHALNGLVIG